MSVTTASRQFSFACPRCFGLVPRLVEVRYAIGLTDVDATWMCDQCLEELRQEEADYTARGDFLNARAAWAIEILRVRGGEDSLSNEPPASPAPRPSAPRSRTPRRGAVPV